MNNGPVGQCKRCGSLRPLTKHRIIPGCRGGTYNPKNVVLACRPCHDILDFEAGVRPLSARSGRYVACEQCGDVSEKIEVGMCRACRNAAKEADTTKTGWLQAIHGPPPGTFSIGQIARWK